MLYKFKSAAAADVIMAEANGRQLLEIIGKGPGVPGIVTVEQASGAVAALQAAVQAEEAAPRAADAATEQQGGDADAASRGPDGHISLRQRAAPLIDMLRRSAAEGKVVTW